MPYDIVISQSLLLNGDGTTRATAVHEGGIDVVSSSPACCATVTTVALSIACIPISLIRASYYSTASVTCSAFCCSARHTR